AGTVDDHRSASLGRRGRIRGVGHQHRHLPADPGPAAHSRPGHRVATARHRRRAAVHRRHRRFRAGGCRSQDRIRVRADRRPRCGHAAQRVVVRPTPAAAANLRPDPGLQRRSHRRRDRGHPVYRGPPQPRDRELPLQPHLLPRRSVGGAGDRSALMAVFDADIQITMRGVSDPIGLPYTVNPVELVDREALVELREGPAGPEGPRGDPAWPWTWMGDVPDFAALQGMGLGYGDARKAWRVVAENAVYSWTGQDWIRFEQAFQSPGRQGPANQPVGAAIAGPVGSTAAATITGTAPHPLRTLTLPRGITGEQGDPGQAGAINDAADVIAPDDSRQDSVLAWDADDSKWRGVPHPKLAGPWALGA